MVMHPSEEIHLKKSEKLSGKRIALGITGSVGAVQCVRFIRELIRHGAQVIPVMSKAARQIITPDSIRFAAGREPICEITGDVEHVRFCGSDRDKVDLFLVAPCTANAISKMALGISDTPVTLFAVTALGNDIPLMILPAMHATMYEHPSIKRNMKGLEDMGAVFIRPIMREKKAKIANMDLALENVIRILGTRDLENREVLVIAGSTAEPIDDVRMLTNRSSGNTGISLAVSAFERGAEVEMWYGLGRANPPHFIKTKRFDTIDSLISMVDYTKFFTYDIIINCAAISDYTVQKEKGKIRSGKEQMVLPLKPTPSVIGKIRKKAKGRYMVGFKLESDLPKRGLIDRGKKKLLDIGLDMIVANNIQDVKRDKAKIYIIGKDHDYRTAQGSKMENANVIFDEILKGMKEGGS